MLASTGSADTGQPFPKWQTVGNFANQIDCNTSTTTQQSMGLARYGQITNAQNVNQTDAGRF